MLAFTVRPSFTVKLTCQRINKDAACLPITPITVDFNAPVPRDVAAGLRLKAKDGQSYQPVITEKASSVQTIDFKGPFPEKASFTLELPRAFRDDAGREPENKSAFPIETATDEFPPLVKFPGRFGILELNAEPLLPVTVRNVEATLAGQTVAMSPADPQPVPGRTVRLGGRRDPASLPRIRTAGHVETRGESAPARRARRRGARDRRERSSIGFRVAPAGRR